MMWVGEQITERGIGNGISLIIFAGIVDGIPERRLHTTSRRTRGTSSRSISRSSSRSSLVTVATIVFFERGAAADPDLLRAPHGRPTRLRRADGAPAAPREHGGHDPADLRLVAPHVPGDARELQDPGMAALQSMLQRGDWLFNTFYVAAHRLLLLLLHGRHVPAGRRRGQPEEAAGVHPEHPAGQADGRLHRPRAHADHVRRRRSTSRPSASSPASSARRSTSRSAGAGRRS